MADLTPFQISMKLRSRGAGERMPVVRGEWPYLECSSRGDRRFSDMYATVDCGEAGWRTINEAYHRAMIFPDGRTNLLRREASHFTPVNRAEVHALYTDLWRGYVLNDFALMMVLVLRTALLHLTRFGSSGKKS